MQSSRLAKCVGSDLHCGLYFQWQLSFQSLCNPVRVCFFLVLLWVLIKPSGAVCRHRRWFPGLPGASRTSSAEGCGQKPLCLCLLMPPGGDNWYCYLPHQPHWFPQKQNQDQAGSLQSCICSSLSEPLEAAVWSAGIHLFGVCLPISWYFKPYHMNIKAFHDWGKTMRGGKNEEGDFKSHCFWALLWWQLLSLSIDSFI